LTQIIAPIGGEPEPFAMARVGRVARRPEREDVMDKDRIIGSTKEIKGSIKEKVGKAVGDAKLQSEGKAEKAEGKVQNALGGLKDTVKDALKK
jgi:uncharacterized protein YjbJ (UPF0337 family)